MFSLKEKREAYETLENGSKYMVMYPLGQKSTTLINKKESSWGDSLKLCQE